LSSRSASELYSYIERSSVAAMAIYLGLLLIHYYYDVEGIEERVLSILLDAGLTPQELKEAQEALKILVDLMRVHPSKRSWAESLEEYYYDKFKDALYRYIRRDANLDDVKRIIDILLELRRVNAYALTKKGSFSVVLFPSDVEVKEDDVIIKRYNLSLKKLKEIGFYVPVGRGGSYIIVPAPYLDMDIFKLFEASKKVEVKEVERAKISISLKPSREVLESIVAEALRNLGFAAQTNVKLPAKGGDIETDVWAVKNIGGAQFRVYVSCKNWDKDVDRQVVDQEFGRVLQLYQLPHLRILVVKSLTEPAKKAAFDDGFFVIELGEKANIENAQEIYEVVYNKLKDIFIGITPEKVLKAVERLKEAMRYLEEII
jgi:hypothetical protein